MQNNSRDDYKNNEFDQEENSKYGSNEKCTDVPEWNEGIQKIIVGYH